MYVITAAYLSGKQLTPRQRTDSYFTSEPRIGSFVLRPGLVLRLSEAEYAEVEQQVRRLLQAEAIVVEKDGEAVAPPEPPPTPQPQNLVTEVVAPTVVPQGYEVAPEPTPEIPLEDHQGEAAPVQQKKKHKRN
jgi:hypothetical protein